MTRNDKAKAREAAEFGLRALVVGRRDEASDLDRRKANRTGASSKIDGHLEAEKLRGRVGHWAYDPSRHIALLQAAAIARRGQGIKPKT